MKKFEEFFADSFKNGSCCRELRLSASEVAYIHKHYPEAILNRIAQDSSDADEKSWFEVRIGVPV